MLLAGIIYLVEETIRMETKPNKYEGLKAAMAAELMVWFLVWNWGHFSH